ncbi:nitroreductase/quinone reductase family protein [Actinoplanes oblitus]|uniref:Nitroreductase/quinone reductase family protein n=1 Tax=Actinoplanes oblitus TaxID=3040509 RepID=A0ABY8W7C8_9ACTN|nr:nitroreductase/quinone reductase family protein [Actinoplanes oblitus]WIM92855.1 nitroreductase/quinone reductase family protein [Actinoplanes oblitus]
MLLSQAARRRMYRGGRPDRVARWLNRLSAAQFSAGFLTPATWVTLEVTGRRSGRTISCPLVVTRYRGERYLVAMLGRRANWVANVRAADGTVVLRHGDREEARLVEVEPRDRAPILRAFLAAAPGARAHLPVDRHAALADFARIADDYPVFRIITSGRPAEHHRPAGRRTWGELSPAQRTAVLVLGSVEVALTVTAALDLARRPAGEVRGPKALWWPALLVQPMGPPSYLVWGRRR